MNVPDRLLFAYERFVLKYWFVEWPGYVRAYLRRWWHHPASPPLDPIGSPGDVAFLLLLTAVTSYPIVIWATQFSLPVYFAISFPAMVFLSLFVAQPTLRWLNNDPVPEVSP